MNNREDLESRLRSYLSTGARTQPPSGIEARIAARIVRRGHTWVFQLAAAAAVVIVAVGLGVGLNKARQLNGLVVKGTPSPSPLLSPSASASPSVKPSPTAMATPRPGASLYPLMVPASMHMVNASTGWAAGSTTDRILRTTDGGAHWNDVTPSAARLGNWTTFFLDAQNAWLASSVQPGSPTSDFSVEIYRTSDGGRSWSQVGTAMAGWGFPAAIDFVDRQHGWLFMKQDGTLETSGSDMVAFYGTTDGGATWTELSEADATGAADRLPVRCSKGEPVFLNPTTGWMPGGCSVDALGPYFYVTHDGGRSWRDVGLSLPAGWTGNCLCSIDSLRFSDARNGVFVLMTYPPDGPPQSAIYATSDGGASWRPGPSLPPQAYGVYFVDPSHGWTLNLKASSLLSTADGGNHWSIVGTVPSTMGPVDVEFITSRTAWLMGMEPKGRTIFKTVDGGLSWTVQLSP